MNKRIIKPFKENNGAVSIVEATFVFPIMFFVLLFIILLGNIYYQQAKIDGIVAEYAVIGAQRVVNPLQKSLDDGASLPTDSETVDAQPYRYIFGSMESVEDDIQTEVFNKIKKTGFTFMGRNPKLSKGDVKAKYDNHVLYGYFTVEATYSIPFPIKFLGSSKALIYKGSSYSQVAVNDVPEFIRNVDLVIDLTEKTKFGQTIAGLFKKINDFISKFSGK